MNPKLSCLGWLYPRGAISANDLLALRNQYLLARSRDEDIGAAFFFCERRGGANQSDGRINCNAGSAKQRSGAIYIQSRSRSPCALEEAESGECRRHPPARIRALTRSRKHGAGNTARSINRPLARGAAAAGAGGGRSPRARPHRLHAKCLSLLRGKEDRPVQPGCHRARSRRSGQGRNRADDARETRRIRRNRRGGTADCVMRRFR